MTPTPYTNQAVRDLAWAVSSPPLVSAFRGERALFLESREQREMSRDVETLLSELELDSTPLTRFLEKKGPIKRLGRYFEALIEFWLTTSKRYELLHYGLQLKANKLTLGEFDALLIDHETGETLHWELAVKYYLYIEQALQVGDWVGPNSKDRFEEKLTHLCQKQSKLSQSTNGKKFLRELGIEVDRSVIILKGYLFRPETGAIPLSGCEEGAEHLRGWWRSYSEFMAAEDLLQSDFRWCIAHRLRWMSPYELVREEECFSGEEILNCVNREFVRYSAPLLLVQLEGSQEVSRGFVCPDEWLSNL